MNTTNEIVIFETGARQIAGKIAHDLAFSPSWKTVEGQLVKGRFHVFEGEILRASQTSFRDAYSYMNQDRVLVYFQ